MNSLSYSSFLGDEFFSVFLFHGVLEKKTNGILNYNKKHLGADYFYGVLKDLIGSGGSPVSMDEILWAAENNERLPEKAFAITFDDGFLNNKSVAAKILADLSIPATFYVTTEFIEKNNMSWIDQIEFAVEFSECSEIYVEALGKFLIDNPKSKIEFLEHVRWKVKNNKNIDPCHLAEEVQTTLIQSIKKQSDTELYQKMSWSDIIDLNHNDLFSVGGHTHTHQILTHLNKQELEFEISHCLKLLFEKANLETHHFSYPEGQANCFDKKVVSQLLKCGIKICPSAIHGVNNKNADLFALKRINVV